MRMGRAWLLIACSVFPAACGPDPVPGSGNIVAEPRAVSGFSAVSLSGSGRVIIEQTGTEALTVTTDDNLLPYIKTEVRGNKLELGLKNSMDSVNPTNDITFHLQVKSLDGLDVSGSGRMEAKGLNPDQLSVNISGSGQVFAQGTASDLALSISGSGSYQGEQMTSKQVAVNVSGSGDALVAASDTLTAHVSGSGSVEYIGAPQVTQQVSGSGSVRRR